MDIKQLITDLTVRQTGLKLQLKDLTESRATVVGNNYEVAVETDYLDNSISGIRGDLMQNRLGEDGLRSLNKELANTRERSSWY